MLPVTGRFGGGKWLRPLTGVGRYEDVFITAMSGCSVTIFGSMQADTGWRDIVPDPIILDRALDTLERCSKPVIAAICGACAGGGALIAAVSDLRIAARNARQSTFCPPCKM